MKLLWKILKRCEFCYSKNVEYWDDSKYKQISFGWYGWHCKNCDMITLTGNAD